MFLSKCACIWPTYLFCLLDLLVLKLLPRLIDCSSTVVDTGGGQSLVGDSGTADTSALARRLPRKLYSTQAARAMDDTAFSISDLVRPHDAVRRVSSWLGWRMTSSCLYIIAAPEVRLQQGRAVRRLVGRRLRFIGLWTRRLLYLEGKNMNRFVCSAAGFSLALLMNVAQAAEPERSGPEAESDLTGCGLLAAHGAALPLAPAVANGRDAAAGLTAAHRKILEQLRKSMEQRLALMPDVARYKWSVQRPVDDFAREAIIVRRFAAEAEKHGVPAAWAARFFQAQIDAAKQVQRACLVAWTAGAAPAIAVLDLATEIRPRLDALEKPLLESLAAAWPLLADSGKRAQVTAIMGLLDGAIVSPEVAELALAPLKDGSARQSGLQAGQ